MIYQGEDTPCWCEEWLADPNRLGSWNWCGSKHCIVLFGTENGTSVGDHSKKAQDAGSKPES